MSLKQAYDTIKEYDLWPIYILGVTAFIPFQPAASYLSYILKNMGYSTFDSNVLAIPGQFLFLINLPLIVWISEKLNERTFCSMWSNVWVFPFLVALITIPKSASTWVRYVLLTGLNAEPYVHAILVGWASKLSNRVETRAISTSFYNMCYQIGSVAAANIYRNSDRPYYYKGNKILLALTCFNIAFFIFTKMYYKARNKAKKREWNKLTSEQQKEYIHSKKALGPKSLIFEFAH